MTTAHVRSPWIRQLRTSQSALTTLVCMPHAGGCASFFKPWLTCLPEQFDLFAVQYPGREERYTEPCVTAMDDLSEQVTQALLPHARQRPLALFGHSLGASLAYEVALKLEGLGFPPLRLFASAHPSPRYQRPSDLHRQGDTALLEDVHRLAGPGADLLKQPELRDLFLPMLRGDYLLIETYRCAPDSRLHTAVDVLVPENDSEITEDEAKGWQDVSLAPIHIHRLEGDHFYLKDRYPELVRLLTERLLDSLNTGEHGHAIA